MPGAVADGEELLDARRGDPVMAAALAAPEAGPDLTDADTFNAWFQAVAALRYAVRGEREQAHARAARYDLAAMRAYFGVEPPEGWTARC